MTSNSPAAMALVSGSAQPVFGLVRFLVSGALAVIVTAGLFFVMQALIRDDSVPVPVSEPAPVIEISFNIIEYELTQMTLDDVQPVEPPPLHPTMRTPAQSAPGVEPISMSAPAIEYTVEPIAQPAVSFTIPPITNRVDPVYPQRELSRGMQGSCTVQYDILASGRTANAQALACDSDGFARASLAAVARWTHAMEVGRPGDEVVRRGVQTQLEFQLE
ncbi:MAG: energy transducer TonB [Oceanicaulis sp.]|nr:energy transducer TonB [Oceanicaulis sp.]